MNLFSIPRRRIISALLISIFTVSSGLIAGCGLDLLTKRSSDKPSGPVQVMFIGNSLTGWGDTMVHFGNLADSAGIEVVIGSRVVDGAGMRDHVESFDTKWMIQQQQWNYVVLQGGSYLIAFPDSLDVVAEPYETLKEIIRNNWGETRIVLFMDWAMNPMPGGYYTFSEFSQMLHDGTLLLAKRLGCMIAPVGWMWKQVVEERPEIELNKDPVHPNITGGYLQACVYFATIFQKSPVGNIYIGRLDKEVAEYLQQTAADVVLKNRSKWRLPGS